MMNEKNGNVPAPFEGFPDETIRFFLDLRFHNETKWFHEHHDEYERFVRKPFISFIESMAPSILQISEDMELRPNRCLARINRDIRYTRDKSPYRDHLWILFRRAGEEREQSVMYWFELAPERVQWGLGFWGMNRPAMDVLRCWMETKPSMVLDAIRSVPNEHFEILGESYARKNIPETVPAELRHFYPMKAIYIERLDTSLRDVYSPCLADMVSGDFLHLKPMYTLLRKAADLAVSGLNR